MKKLAIFFCLTIVLSIFSCNKGEEKSLGKTSQHGDAATVIEGIIIDESIPAFKITRFLGNNLYGIVNLAQPSDTIEAELLMDAKVNGDIFDGNIVTMTFAKNSEKPKKIKSLENYDYVYTKFLQTVSGRWTSYDDDTLYLYTNGKAISKLKEKKYEGWHVVGQPSLRGFNGIVLLGKAGEKKQTADTVYINMERKYLNFGDEDDLALKYDGKID